jgi:predicted aspartyl protease
MRKIVLFTAMVFLAGCSSQKVIMTKDCQLDASNQIEFHYENIQQAFDDFAVDSVLARAADEYNKNYVNLFRYLSEGNDASAQVLFDRCAASDTGFVRKNLSCLMEYYFKRASWKRIGELERRYGMETSYHELARAFASAASEEIHFPLADSVSIPILRYNLGGTPIVELFVNGKKKKFLVDTGFSFTAITPETAKDCGIGAVDDSSNLGLVDANGNYSRNAARLCIIKELAIGDLRVSNHTAIVTRNANLRIAGVKVTGWDGIIGWNFLQNFRVRIDWRRNQFTLSPSVGCDSTMKPRILYSLSSPFVRLRLSNGRYANFHFDTGANRVGLFNSIETKYRSRGKNGRSWSFALVKGGRVRHVEYPNFGMFINGNLFTFDKVKKMDRMEKLYNISKDGWIGTSLFKGRCLTFDYKSGLFEVE